MPRERVQVIGHAAADPAAVWAVAGDFLGRWHPAIERIEAEPGPHLTRRFTVKGEDTVYRERLIYRSDSDHVVSYTALAGIEGADRYVARLSVAPVEGGGSSILWTADITARADRLAAICTGTEAVFRAGLDVLAALQGHQRPRTQPPLPRSAIWCWTGRPGWRCRSRASVHWCCSCMGSAAGG